MTHPCSTATICAPRSLRSLCVCVPGHAGRSARRSSLGTWCWQPPPAGSIRSVQAPTSTCGSPVSGSAAASNERDAKPFWSPSFFPLVCEAELADAGATAPILVTSRTQTHRYTGINTQTHRQLKLHINLPQNKKDPIQHVLQNLSNTGCSPASLPGTFHFRCAT